MPMTEMPEYFTARERNFTRFQKQATPRCPMHGAMRLSKVITLGKGNIGRTLNFDPGTERKIYRCKNKSCHFVASADGRYRHEW